MRSGDQRKVAKAQARKECLSQGPDGRTVDVSKEILLSTKDKSH